VGKPESKRPLGSPRQIWEDNYKRDIKIRLEGMNWNDLAQNRGRWQGFFNMVMNLWIP